MSSSILYIGRRGIYLILSVKSFSKTPIDFAPVTGTIEGTGFKSV
jgi:hypothetical protein